MSALLESSQFMERDPMAEVVPPFDANMAPVTYTDFSVQEKRSFALRYIAENTSEQYADVKIYAEVLIELHNYAHNPGQTDDVRDEYRQKYDSLFNDFVFACPDLAIYFEEVMTWYESYEENLELLLEVEHVLEGSHPAIGDAVHSPVGILVVLRDKLREQFIAQREEDVSTNDDLKIEQLELVEAELTLALQQVDNVIAIEKERKKQERIEMEARLARERGSYAMSGISGGQYYGGEPGEWGYDSYDDDFRESPEPTPERKIQLLANSLGYLRRTYNEHRGLPEFVSDAEWKTGEELIDGTKHFFCSCIPLGGERHGTYLLASACRMPVKSGMKLVIPKDLSDRIEAQTSP